MRKYDDELYSKPRWLVLNKIDLLPEERREAKIRTFVDAYFADEVGARPPVFAISAINGTGCDAVVYAVMEFLEHAAVAHDSAAEIGSE